MKVLAERFGLSGILPYTRTQKYRMDTLPPLPHQNEPKKKTEFSKKNLPENKEMDFKNGVIYIYKPRVVMARVRYIGELILKVSFICSYLLKSYARKGLEIWRFH